MPEHANPHRRETFPPSHPPKSNRKCRWRTLLPWRWWWNTSLVLILVLCLSQYWTERNWYLLPGRMNVVVGSLMIFLWLSLAAWLFVAVPWLCARDQTPRFRAPPLIYFITLRFLVWTPAFLIVGEMLFELMYVAAPHYFRTGMFRLRLPWWYFLPALLLLALAIWYARAMARLLKNRMQTQAAQIKQCFECGYPLHSITSCRCPECGKTFATVSISPTLVSD